MALSLAGTASVHAQAQRQASGQVAPASIEPQMAMATLSPEGQRDAQYWVRYGSWPAGVPVVVTAIDSGRTVRARTAGGLSGGGAAMVYSAGVGAALGLNPDRPTALLVRMDTTATPAPALAPAPSAAAGGPNASASLPASSPPAAPSNAPTAQVVDRSVPAKSGPAAAVSPSAVPPAALPPAAASAPSMSPAPARAAAAATAQSSAAAAGASTRSPAPTADLRPGLAKAPAAPAQPVPLPAAARAATVAEPAVPKPAPRLAAASGKALYLQIGAFADEKNAWALFAKVRALKLPEGVMSEILQLDGLHRVRVGPFESRAQRDAVSKQLEEVAGVTPIKLRL